MQGKSGFTLPTVCAKKHMNRSISRLFFYLKKASSFQVPRGRGRPRHVHDSRPRFYCSFFFSSSRGDPSAARHASICNDFLQQLKNNMKREKGMYFGQNMARILRGTVPFSGTWMYCTLHYFFWFKQVLGSQSPSCCGLYTDVVCVMFLSAACLMHSTCIFFSIDY